jgi:hypothetical protein
MALLGNLVQCQREVLARNVGSEGHRVGEGAVYQQGRCKSRFYVPSLDVF